jgi:diacylglycerol O-acyltransferase
VNAIDRLAKLDRLSSLDAAFLSLATPTTPMNIGSVTYLESGQLRDGDGRIRLTDLRRLVDERSFLSPRFRQRPERGPFGLGRPLWIDDPNFDVANHVNEMVLPPPGSEQQLREFCSQLMMRTLDPSRPLWELWVVDGYADGYVVLIEKVHHVMLDGVSGVDVVMLLTDPTPTVEHPSAETPSRHKPDTVTRFAAGLVDELGLPFALAGLPARAAITAATSLMRPEQMKALLGEAQILGRGARSLLHKATVAPRTPLNQPVGRRRTFEHAEWPLAEMRRVSKTFGCTVNDVALAAVTGGVRRLLLDRETDPGSRFQVAVPVSTRSAVEHATLGNQVAAWLVPLPVGVADERQQLEEIHRITSQRKRQGQASAIAAVIGAANRWPMPMVDLVAHLTHHQPFANAVVTNVPGPQSRRYLLGARIRRIVPVVPLAGNLDVSVGIFSYDGEVAFGCYADAERCTDLHVLTDGIRVTLEALGILASQETNEEQEAVAS